MTSLATFVLSTSFVHLFSKPRQTEPPPTPIIQQPARTGDGEKKQAVAEDCAPRFRGRYANYDYAYSVRIPKGMIGIGSCFTNHGLSIDLTKPASPDVRWDEVTSEATLTVYAHYNAAFWRSTDEEIEVGMETIMEKQDAGVKLTSKSQTRLAGLPAVRATLRYHAGGTEMVEDDVVALRRDKHREVEIFYVISLSTPVARYQEDNRVLEEVQRTWRLQPVP